MYHRTIDTVYDVVRLVNAVLASLVFCALVYKGTLYFRNYDSHQKLLYVSFTLYTLATAYGSVEAYSLDIPPGLRIWPFLLANAIALYAFVRYRESAFTAP